MCFTRCCSMLLRALCNVHGGGFVVFPWLLTLHESHGVTYRYALTWTQANISPALYHHMQPLPTPQVTHPQCANDVLIQCLALHQALRLPELKHGRCVALVCIKEQQHAAWAGAHHIQLLQLRCQHGMLVHVEGWAVVPASNNTSVTHSKISDVLIFAQCCAYAHIHSCIYEQVSR